MTTHLAHCYTLLRHAVAPRRALTVSQWADDHRILSGKQASERGRWRTSRNELLREIMDCCSANSQVRDIVIMKSSQVGVTEAMINVLGYTLDHAPCPAMVLLPTLEARDAWKVQKLNPLLQETDVVRAVLGGVRAAEGRGLKADAVVGIGIGGSKTALNEFSKPGATGFYGTVLISPRRHGYETVINMHQWITTGKAPPPVVLTSGTLMTRRNQADVRTQMGL